MPAPAASQADFSRTSLHQQAQSSPSNHELTTTATLPTTAVSASPYTTSVTPPPPSLPSATSQWPRHDRGAILYPELAQYLVHPQVDPYTDAPRVPGQPDPSSLRPPLTTMFIPDFGEQWTPPKYLGQQPRYQTQYLQQKSQPAILDFSVTQCELGYCCTNSLLVNNS